MNSRFQSAFLVTLSYPLLPFLIKECPGGGSTVQDQFFGYRFSSARMVIDCSFGRLKARFGCLRREMDISQEVLPYVVYACLVLHNVCETHEERLASEEMEQ